MTVSYFRDKARNYFARNKLDQKYTCMTKLKNILYLLSLLLQIMQFKKKYCIYNFMVIITPLRISSGNIITQKKCTEVI